MTVRISLVGVPHIESADGKDLTPRGNVLRGVLGTIALSPNMKVSRRWLENLFWPDSTHQSASGSLRQALTTIRQYLGPFSDILVADRLDVSLRSDRVTVDVFDNCEMAFSKLRRGRQLLEGIDVRSENFEEWLRLERARFDDQPEVYDSLFVLGAVQGAKPPILLTKQISEDARLESFVAETISNQLSQTATTHSRTEVRLTNGDLENSVSGAAARCSIRVGRFGRDLVALVKLISEPDGRVVWQRRAEFAEGDHQVNLDVAASLALEATEAFVHTTEKSNELQRANALAASALDAIFSFDPSKLAEADQKLSEARRLDEYAPRPALQALGRAFLALENPQYDEDRLFADVDDLIGVSLSIDATNPVALAFVADVHDLVFDDAETAMTLLKRAIANNPGLGFAYASLGALELRKGEVRQAHLSAEKAQRQLVNTSLEVFSLMRLCITGMHAGNIDQAISAAKRAAKLAPLSCPPLRHLYALYLSRGEREDARDTLRKLKRLDPDFSMQRIREDAFFPAPSIRGMGFHKLADVEL
ncbi:hypothetical protein [Ruegeria sp. EL01]|uniref:hypothetical protein n=1 Tax=Ruegeria sp. EL01 TaxID=2107578 RepID=UPI0013C532DA|nr:hypothetical protein [Ruegeria sp. EL01]